jgi:broad specificity phosphatase PhoE
METRLLLIRHGETEWNRDGRIQGHLDVVLSEQGRGQAGKLARRLAPEPLTAVYASTLARASETAAILAQPHGLTVSTRADLREGCFGAWQGLTMAEVRQRFEANYAAVRQDPIHGRPEDGETCFEMAGRAYRVVEEVAAAHPGGTVAVVTHGGTLKTIISQVLGLDLRYRWRFTVDNCSLTIVAWREGGPVLLTLNDSAHLAGGFLGHDAAEA